MNGWVNPICKSGKGAKTFRTKTYSKNGKGSKMMLTLQCSINSEEGEIPKLKKILRKLESPKNS